MAAYKHVLNDDTIDSESFKSEAKVSGKTSAASNTKIVERAVLLSYLSNPWRILEISLTWSGNCIISAATGATKFAVTDSKLYFSVVSLSTQDNTKLL